MAKRVAMIILISGILFMRCSLLMFQDSDYDYAAMDRTTYRIHKKAERFLTGCIFRKKPVQVPPQTRVDSVKVNKSDQIIRVYFNSYFSYIPLRHDNTDAIYKAFRAKLGWWYRNYTLELYSLETPLEQLIPNFYRQEHAAYDVTRMPYADKKPAPIVVNLDRPYTPQAGLWGRHIALWHSHGWYYNNEKDRWEWQRPRLFQTVEDLLPLSFTIPFLIPMLENAGANVWVPRERDFQDHEVIVDNDQIDSSHAYLEVARDTLHIWQAGNKPGFAEGTTPYQSGENPFLKGSFRQVKSDTTASAQISWIPDIPETGYYGVYISYAHADTHTIAACYTVHHSGGQTEFRVNQQMGGSTWIYLGQFKFEQGRHKERGKVILTNQGNSKDTYVTADAVRFGGGMGNIIREGQLSNRARFLEGARYYLQYAGMPDTLVYSFNKDTNDYNDDYSSRGEWVNYLQGKPGGPNRDRDVAGLNVPIDLSCSFHTDAGITRNGKVVGTLAIYSLTDDDTAVVFPNGISRLACRDLTDILQTQIVQDIRQQYNPDWNRRSLYNARYSEAYRPNVPATLLEFFSHQNFVDMQYGMDPRFRFDFSRSIYKGILKFISSQYQQVYTVQPLPVDHMRVVFSDSGQVTLSWRTRIDSLEASAVADRYVVYTRINDQGFDNGKVVTKPKCVIQNLVPGIVYSFKVTAVNAGGESFPSEILSVGYPADPRDTVLIVNGFDRICAPERVDMRRFKGFANFRDEGVPYLYDLGYTGPQFDFYPFSKFVTNDAPGWGASQANYETTIFAGNHFDYPMVHGQAMLAAGYAYVSASDEAVMHALIDLEQYDLIDLILGEERTTSYPGKPEKQEFKTLPVLLQEKIREYCQSGGGLFISGAYIGTDLFEGRPEDDPDIRFAHDVLKYQWVTNHAAARGGFHSVDSNFIQLPYNFNYNTTLNQKIYRVESPDAIMPADSLGQTILRYSENNFSAAIGYQGDYRLVIMGFPFEAVQGTKQRQALINDILLYLEAPAETGLMGGATEEIPDSTSFN